jgi:hypothetical protein
VHRAPGFPCALCYQGAEVPAQLGRIALRERGLVSEADSHLKLSWLFD